jgi:hypothetical protein
VERELMSDDAGPELAVVEPSTEVVEMASREYSLYYFSHYGDRSDGWRVANPVSEP